MSQTLKTTSRQDFLTKSGGNGTHEEIRTGCLQRIADATELMAKRHLELISDRDYWERRCRSTEAQLVTEKRTAGALRGHLSRLKNASRPDGDPQEAKK